MNTVLRLAKPVTPVLAALAILSALSATAANAAVAAVYSCATGGIYGNHDYVYNGFYVQNVNASNLHSARLYYTADSAGLYNMTLTVRTGGYNGPIVEQMTQNLSLSSSSETAVTWDFDEAPMNPGSTLYFEHTGSGVGGAKFSVRSSGCAGNVENVGTSSIDNGFSVAVTLYTASAPPAPACVPNATTLCLDDQPGDKRFQVRVTYATAQNGGMSGNGKAVSTASLGITKGGLFWFFEAPNPELLVKVVNGCGYNGKRWVFIAATTNVGFTVTVTDMVKGYSKQYTNPDITAAVPVQDTSALSCQ